MSVYLGNVAVVLIWFSMILERSAIETVEKWGDVCSLILKNENKALGQDNYDQDRHGT